MTVGHCLQYCYIYRVDGRVAVRRFVVVWALGVLVIPFVVAVAVVDAGGCGHCVGTGGSRRRRHRWLSVGGASLILFYRRC